MLVVHWISVELDTCECTSILYHTNKTQYETRNKWLGENRWYLSQYSKHPSPKLKSDALLLQPVFSVKYTGYTRLDKIRNEVIRKELEISGIQDVRLKYKQNWINHLERMDNTRLPKHALNYRPRGRRDRGRPRKRWQCVDAGIGQRT